MNWNNLHESKLVRGIIIGIGGTAAVIMIFEAGVFVGFKKAAYSYRLGDNYYRAFRGEKPMTIGFDGDNVPGGHGATGRVIKVALPNLIIADNDDIEKTILIGSSTLIKRFNQTVGAEDIHSDDYVVILGSPDMTSKIHAKFIRLLPPPEEALQESL